MEKFILYNIDTGEKIAEGYDVFMCQELFYMYFDHGVDNIQIQHIKEEKKGE